MINKPYAVDVAKSCPKIEKQKKIIDNNIMFNYQKK